LLPRSEIVQLLTAALTKKTPAYTEEDVRIKFENAFKTYLPQAGIEYDANYEKRVKSGGRVDSLFRHLVVEYKQYNKFSNESEYIKAAGQALDYIESLAESIKDEKSSYIAMLTDGVSMGFARFTLEGKRKIYNLCLINEDVIRIFIEYVHALNFKALSEENVLQDFGPDSDIARQAVLALWKAFNNKTDVRTTMFFSEWKRLFGQVSGFGSGAGAEYLIKKEAEKFGISVESEYAGFVFILHTFYSLLIKLIALFILQSIKNNGFELQVALETSSLVDQKTIMQEIENGSEFKKLGITNFLEGDFFSWYINEWNEDISAVIKRIINELSMYEPSTPSLMPECIRDLLKTLYERLLPKRIRHDLGEFYTPDWLAQYTIQASGMKPKDKVLDPTCGSGTFLVLAIKEKMDKLRDVMPPGELLEHILTHVYGFDLNPLAVIASRTNFLIAIGDLIPYIDNIEIPIYLTDAIFSPQRKDGHYIYSIETDMGPVKMSIPEEIINQGCLGTVLVEIENAVIETSKGIITEDEAKEHLQELLNSLAIPTAFNEVKDLYEKILELEKKNWNRIWCRVIKNHFLSVALRDFDVIIGNPPWLRWSSLPEAYRNTIKSFCVKYGLFSSDTYVGGIESDISTMVLYTSAQKWLKNGGRLAFLITRTVFKTESSEGFRKFRVPNDDNVYFKVIKVEDFTELRPFEGATNKPSLVVLEKGAKTTYPVPWIVWKKKVKKPVVDNFDLNEVKAITFTKELVAYPLGSEGGPWLTVSESSLPQCLAMANPNPQKEGSYVARKGICTDCNGIYFGQVIAKKGKRQVVFKNDPSLGRRKDIRELTFAIEKDIVYPIARGREISAFKWEFGETYGIIPQVGMDGFPVIEMKKKYPKALEYFTNFKDILTERSSYKRYHTKRGASFYSCWNVGPYTFKPYKVGWAEVSGKFEACVLSHIQTAYWETSRVVVPDHKIYFVPLDNELEAHYLCSFLNAPQVEEFVYGYTESTQIGAHITEYLNIPIFDPNNKYHQELALISIDAHKGFYTVRQARERISKLLKGIR